MVTERCVAGAADKAGVLGHLVVAGVLVWACADADVVRAGESVITHNALTCFAAATNARVPRGASIAVAVTACSVLCRALDAGLAILVTHTDLACAVT